jgi:hypothetical protein
MSFRFDEGSQVIVREDHPELDLSAGAVGVVWTHYRRNPPAYDVTFKGPDGVEFDAMMEEDELLAPPPPAGTPSPAATRQAGAARGSR